MTKEQLKKITATNCPIRNTIELVGGKWTFSIIYILMSGTKRFSELEKAIEGISNRMLVKDLKMLEKNEIIIREAFATVPPTVQYTLTEKGRAFFNVLTEVSVWGKKYIQ